MLQLFPMTEKSSLRIKRHIAFEAVKRPLCCGTSVASDMRSSLMSIALPLGDKRLLTLDGSALERKVSLLYTMVIEAPIITESLSARQAKVAPSIDLISQKICHQREGGLLDGVFGGRFLPSR